MDDSHGGRGHSTLGDMAPRGQFQWMPALLLADPMCACAFALVDSGLLPWLAMSLILDEPKPGAFFGNMGIICAPNTPSQWSQFDQDIRIL